MDSEKVLKLFDWFWFDRVILEKQSNFSFSSSSEQNPDCKIDVIVEDQSEEMIKPMNGYDSISMSDHSISFSSSPPNSVILSTSNNKLQTILSEKTQSTEAMKEMKVCKTMSELEYDQEVKGFMEMGFVFSELEDMNLRLLGDIVPGFHRLREEKDSISGDESKINSRTYYLMERRKRFKVRFQKPLLRNWKLPSLNNEMGMKQSLRMWAHTVASTVRYDDSVFNQVF